jgi:hypothetical protein
MDITRKSPYTGNLNVMSIDVTPEQIERYERYEDNAENIFHNLSLDEREFITNGYTPDDWTEILKDWEVILGRWPTNRTDGD